MVSVELTNNHRILFSVEHHLKTHSPRVPLPSHPSFYHSKMIYSGKETQTVSNGHNSNGIHMDISTSNTVPAPSNEGDITPESPLSPVVESNVYYNPRLDPKNFLEGPLSLNPATRLRQLLARPGIVVCIALFYRRSKSNTVPRLHLVSVTAFRLAARLRLASTACTRG